MIGTVGSIQDPLSVSEYAGNSLQLNQLLKNIMASAREALKGKSGSGLRSTSASKISVETIAHIQAKLDLLTAEIASLKAAQN